MNGLQRVLKKLTPERIRILKVWDAHPPCTWLTTRQIAQPLEVPDHFIRMGFASKKLRPLQEVGFLMCKRDGPRKWAHWTLGPMADAAKEAGLLDDHGTVEEPNA
jgi:hypothetical protein